MKITFVTGNANKIKELEDYLGFLIKQEDIDLEEIQSLDLEGVIKHKAKEAYNKVKSLVLVEDISLEFEALNGLPGPFIKWFLKTMGNEGMCKMLGEDRRAIAKNCYAVYDGKKIHLFMGQVRGKIVKKPRGTNNFGFDPIFIPNGKRKTWGEVPLAVKQKQSARGIALKKLKFYLERYDV